MAVVSVVCAAVGLVALVVIVWTFVDDWRDLQGRGEVAGVPDEMDEACALTQLPVHRPVRLVRDYPTTPAERSFADAVENWMKEQVR